MVQARLSTSSRKCKGHFRFSLLMSYSCDPIVDMEFYPAAESLIVSLNLQASGSKDGPFVTEAK